LTSIARSKGMEEKKKGKISVWKREETKVKGHSEENQREGRDTEPA